MPEIAGKSDKEMHWLFARQVLGSGYWVMGIGFWEIQDAGFKMQDSGSAEDKPAKKVERVLAKTPRRSASRSDPIARWRDRSGRNSD